MPLSSHVSVANLGRHKWSSYRCPYVGFSCLLHRHCPLDPPSRSHRFAAPYSAYSRLSVSLQLARIIGQSKSTCHLPFTPRPDYTASWQHGGRIRAPYLWY